ncbi:hypothetical protein NEOLEDRAFT_1127599 [Neolentinus lepideus HHB14362 ss-1]|uniref:Putative gamma-glutamylcyclotransferase n=1 Tax=Neolentinus lepideus HHB14362 ss-1 TaxID=1314782 RepID=A0A165VJR6_9AGAM|nr:hypothetical protein NEOLEDRAFT_1127599 [Neolentinus lepideus HHB14362 ss-1]
MASTTAYAAFFYGTLLHPKILKRVIGNDGSHLQICPAILLNYTRHHIKYADYPAIVPYERSQVFFDKSLEPEERSVRGTLVTGLNQLDMDFLDTFEGDEYIRTTVPVYPLSSLVPLNSVDDSSSSTSQDIAPPAAPSLPSLSSLPPPVDAQTYVWTHPVTELNKEIWEYETFVRENAWKWTGEDKDGTADAEDSRDMFYTEVERRRAMGNNIV